jgi:hypothetical protein
MSKKLEELRKLESNWDSYGGKPITELALEKTDLLLKALLGIQAVEPFVCPCSNGGIQLEWHRNGYTLEIEISPEGEVSEVFCAEVIET